MQVNSANDIKVYNLSAGKNLPEWISDRKKRTLLKNDVGLRQRIELIQDFSMPVASTNVKVSADGQYIFATGVYKPRVRCYDVHHLSMKFERCIDAETVDMNILSDDYTKFVLLLANRQVEFHAQFGFYYRTRVPRFGRSLAYHSASCDLYVAAEGPEVFRLNLAQGQFMPPLTTRASGCNVCEFNPHHQLFTVGTEDGTIECWDPRSQSRVGEVSLASADINFSDSRDTQPAVTALQYRDAMNLAVGTSSGQVLLYDLRSPRPYQVKDHLYSSPIHSISFQTSERLVLSADSKILKIWNENDGSSYTSIEPDHDINKVYHLPGSGLVLMAVEDPKMLAYYVPSIGPAPRWCSFLDNLTEELEEDPEPVVYEDYKFVTAQNLDELGLSHLIGSNLLQAYMHGYFMDMKLYHKAKSIAEPFAYDEYRKAKIKKKIEEARATRIRLKALPKVNRQLAEKLLDDVGSSKKKKKKQSGNGGEGRGVEPKEVGEELDPSNPLGDQRFATMFTNVDFEVDPESEAYQRLHPVLSHRQKMRDKKKKTQETASLKAGEEDGELEGRPSDAASSSDESDHEVWAEIRRKRRDKKKEEQAKALPFSVPPSITMTTGTAKPAALNEKLSRTSLGKRLEQEAPDMMLSSRELTLGSKEHTFAFGKVSNKQEEDRKKQLRDHQYERRKLRRSASSVLPRQNTAKVFWRGKRVK